MGYRAVLRKRLNALMAEAEDYKRRAYAANDVGDYDERDACAATAMMLAFACGHLKAALGEGGEGEGDAAT